MKMLQGLPELQTLSLLTSTVYDETFEVLVDALAAEPTKLCPHLKLLDVRYASVKRVIDDARRKLDNSRGKGNVAISWVCESKVVHMLQSGNKPSTPPLW